MKRLRGREHRRTCSNSLATIATIAEESVSSSCHSLQQQQQHDASNDDENSTNNACYLDVMTDLRITLMRLNAAEEELLRRRQHTASPPLGMDETRSVSSRSVSSRGSTGSVRSQISCPVSVDEFVEPGPPIVSPTGPIDVDEIAELLEKKQPATEGPVDVDDFCEYSGAADEEGSTGSDFSFSLAEEDDDDSDFESLMGYQEGCEPPIEVDAAALFPPSPTTFRRMMEAAKLGSALPKLPPIHTRAKSAGSQYVGPKF